MVRTLISLDVGLASRMAIGYACRLAQLVDMTIETLHVEKAAATGDSPPGTGWVLKTWEKGLLETASDEIIDLIRAATEGDTVFGSLKMFVGNRDTVVLRELKEKGYDLLIEGSLLSFNPAPFAKKIQSPLYRKAPCPILLVKNRVTLKRMALLLKDQADLDFLIPALIDIFGEARPPIDLFHLKLPGKPSPVSGSEEKGIKTPRGTDPDNLLSSAKKALGSAGWAPERTVTTQDDPDQISDSLHAYGLVVSCLPRKIPVDPSMVEILNRLSSAVLLFRR